ncbi:DUF2141 domain-containing protein [Cryomorphaceae bacterium 1068]|nr:DUF2141 domain-containing protein [Cryomorphaceae bacterium 1068]
MKIILSLCIALMGFFSASNGSEELISLKVRIKNVENEDSNIMIAVFRSYDTFLTEDMHRQEVIAVKNFTETEVEFKLAKGEYAIAVFQDKNKNGDLDRNFFAYPSEPFGFSNNFRPLIKPPHWTDVAFQVDSESAIEIELK